MSIGDDELQAMITTKQTELSELKEKISLLDTARNETLNELVQVQGEIRLLNQLMKKGKK